MTLCEATEKPLSNTTTFCDIVEVKYHTNDHGIVESIIVKYVPKDLNTCETHF